MIEYATQDTEITTAMIGDLTKENRMLRAALDAGIVLINHAYPVDTCRH